MNTIKKRQWIPTHIVTINYSDVEVMLVEGAAYTESEWKNYLPADIECTETAWLFQGKPFNGAIRKI